jgi:RNA polymerase-binding protein DksA
MWMTREEIAEKLGIVVNSVRGKVQKGQIERKMEGGKNWYRIADADAVKTALPEIAPPEIIETPPQPVKKPEREKPAAFNPKQVLMDQLASTKVGRSIEAIEKGDEIDLATGEISRELDAKITMRQHKQVKEIEEALERLKYGEYGECQECGEPVPEQRLRLFPAARYCVRCQEDADRHERIKAHQGSIPGGAKDDSSDVYMKGYDD